MKMKTVNVNPRMYIDFNKENTEEGPNWSEEVFMIKKVKNTVPWRYVIKDLNVEEIVGTFYEKELEKTNQH